MAERRITLGELLQGIELATGEKHRLILSVHDRIEVLDAFFNHDSALLLPDAPAPNPKDCGLAEDVPFANTELWQALQDSHPAFAECARQPFDPAQAGLEDRRSGASVLLAALRFAAAHPNRRLVVAGHTDTLGKPAHNEELSRRRAASVLALLEGDREAFVEAVESHRSGKDDVAFLRYAARTRGWPCDVPPKEEPSVADIRSLQWSYNEEFGDIGRTRLVVDGVVGPKTLGAYFDIMEDDIVKLAGGVGALEALRKKLQYADPKKKVLACGERYPIDQATKDEFDSQTNRRVELLFFDPFDLPDMKSADAADRIYQHGLHPLRTADVDESSTDSPPSDDVGREPDFGLVPVERGEGEPAPPELDVTTAPLDVEADPNDSWAFLAALDEPPTTVVNIRCPSARAGAA